MKKCFTAVFLFFGVLSFAWNGPKGIDKIDPVLLQEFSTKPQVDYLVFLKDRKVFEKPLALSSKEAKGNYVYKTLSTYAQQSQAAIRKVLDQYQVDYHPFWVINAIKVTSDLQLVHILAARNDVEKIIANTPHKMLQEPITERSLGQSSTRNAEPEWGIKAIAADSVWLEGNTGQGVVIGGQDTGFEWNLSPIRTKYRGFISEEEVDHNYNWYDAIHEKQAINYPDSIPNPCGFNAKEPCDDNNHGTHTMGTMVGQDEDNSIGVAPGARWIACRNMDRGWGSIASYVACFEWFIAPTDLDGANPDPSKAPHVINNSWYCSPEEGCELNNFYIIEDVVKNVKAAGIVVVVSAGNDGYRGCGSIDGPPAIFDASFSVGATDINNDIAGFSSRGPVTIDSTFRLKPNVVAPGVNVRSVIRGGQYANYSGTSMAGPHVAGLVALMIAANPKLAGEVSIIEDMIQASSTRLASETDCEPFNGDVIPNAIYGYGLVNAYRAVRRAKGYTPVSTEDIQNNIRVIPNPTHDVVTFIIDKGDQPVRALEIYNANGTQVMQGSFDSEQILQTIDTSHLQGGLYIYRIWVGDKSFTGRFVKI
ncbi:MAG: S8 family peptidase [Chitinophagales bacterium]|nr:S8 family peptidase [Chitinophagales bacterium]